MATSKENLSIFMQRRAIDPYGQLGSLYDGCRDRTIQVPNRNYQERCLSVSESSQCKLMSGTTVQNTNLLECIGVQDELRLSLLLKLAKRDGIGAILDYSNCIDGHTRFLYYSWIAREHRLQKYPRIEQLTEIWSPGVSITHMITSVNVGIDIIVILQLPSSAAIANKIDLILNKIRDTFLKDENNIYRLSADEHEILEHILKTTVYSNIDGLTYLRNISHILQYIEALKKNTIHCCPVSYTIRSISFLYPVHIIKAVTYKPLLSDLGNNIEKYLLQFRNKLKYAETSLKEIESKITNTSRQQLFSEIRLPFARIKEKYMKEMQQFAKLIVDARSNQMNTLEINQALCNNERITSEKSIDTLIQRLLEFKTKGPGTTSLVQQKIKCLNEVACSLDANDDKRTIECKSTSADPRDRYRNSTDTFKTNSPSKLTDQHQRSVENHENNSISRPASADFSKNHLKVSESSIIHTSQILLEPISAPTSSFNDIINILLLGETDVDKSAFINAFANYLVFNSLEQAQSYEPIIIIPSSYTMTIGDNFEEYTIKFGGIDSSNTENFNNVGQSVTQHCKSYVFDLKENGRQLRIIDTPGFGDTRDLEQDNQNMERILQYINNLTHLHAICFLLKPNSSQLYMLFVRTCFTQLSSFLAPAAQQNIIFVFTNARSTFYTPGETGSLLKTILQSFSANDIPFQKANTFYFDIQWFRYLLVLQNEVWFNKEVRYKCEKNWSMSVKESNRLIDYIDEKLTPYHMDNGWQSIKHAQFEIFRMIRPMLEAMRNILRNIILCKDSSSNEFIKLHPTPLHRTAARCLACKSNPDQVGKFWILTNFPHEIQTECLTCSCSLDQHVPIDYLLKYQCSYDTSIRNQNALNDILQILCNASAQFAHFLINIAHSTKGDPFCIGLIEMITEEGCIFKNQNLARLNTQLFEELTNLKNLYNQQINNMPSNQEYAGLAAIYPLIETISKCPLVHEQLVAVKKTQQMTMQQHEFESLFI